MDWSRKWFEGFRGVIREGVPLAPLSHMRVGGKAAVFLEPWSEEDAAIALRVCKENDLPLLVLGGGSNILVADEGVEAFVMSLARWNRVVKDEQRLIASAGASLPSLISKARNSGLAGLETLAGIPAQVGGAVHMNAGTKFGETFDHLVSVRVIDDEGKLRTLERHELSPSYRDGGLRDWIVTTATFQLVPESREEIRARLEEYLVWRGRNQPVTEKSLGCIFKNPPGASAGELIDRAGMKGERSGAIEVSTKHANYFVNRGGGTAADVLRLADKVRAAVHKQFDVELEFEIRLWGFRDL